MCTAYADERIRCHRTTTALFTHFFALTSVRGVIVGRMCGAAVFFAIIWTRCPRQAACDRERDLPFGHCKQVTCFARSTPEQFSSAFSYGPEILYSLPSLSLVATHMSRLRCSYTIDVSEIDYNPDQCVFSLSPDSAYIHIRSFGQLPETSKGFWNSTLSDAEAAGCPTAGLPTTV